MTDVDDWLNSLTTAFASSSTRQVNDALAELDRLRVTHSSNDESDQAELVDLTSSFDQDPEPSLLNTAYGESLATEQQHQAVEASGQGQVGTRQWLKSIINDDQVATNVITLLKQHVTTPASNVDDLANTLIDLVGFEHVDAVADMVAFRNQLANEPTTTNEHVQHGRVNLKLDNNTADGNDMTSRYDDSLYVSQQQQSQQHTHRDHTPQAQITFQTTQDKMEHKRLRKLQQKVNMQHKSKDGTDQYVNLEEWDKIRLQQLTQGPGDMFDDRPSVVEHERLPNVYLAPGSTGSNMAMGGQRLALPVGTTREEQTHYDEITIPAPKAVPFRFDEALVPIKSMDAWGKRTFHAYESLNRLQSIVYPVAYHTNENMLVCAPTGAGKTDVALLTILRCLSSLSSVPLHSNEKPRLPPPSQYKIIYVAPLKALAAEITLKFAKRLSWAGVKVRELTGDMKLTRKEVDETGVIVTTPEKWDVVTRRGSGSADGEVAEKVKLLIIDEVHLLHEDRGAVIESIVARTLRQVESTQNLIRIVGLSATLPNYVDVADFLRVNRYQGLFYFDASFRPVPLEQHFIGVKGKPGSVISRNNLDTATFDKVAELLKAGHQVMVFVHARKDTVKTAQTLREKANEEGIMDLLDPNSNNDTASSFSSFHRDLSNSRNKEMKELAALGFGIHHAGMLRSDRNITERMFEANVTKVLCCTATLAWGVNLPAYAVVIKGTQVYDAGKGSFVDLGILDVLQIFGRAGRPQYESQGVGYICTTYDKMDHYVSAITQQHAIESKFVEGLVDSLNAEVSLGTVTTMDEGVRWLGYSYLFVRMRKNPLVYGMVIDDVLQDPLLGSKRMALMNNSVKRLLETQMVKHDAELGSLEPTDLGRVASKYYIKHGSIEIFNTQLRPTMSEADVLKLISASTEFAQITVRDNEVVELKKMMETVTPCQVQDATETSAGKVNVLLQAYISRAYVEDFALVSDTAYVAQNAGRIVRALLEIAMAKRWAQTTFVLVSMSKAIEKRMWSFKHPLEQFDLPADVLYNVERWADEIPIEEIAIMPPAEFGSLIHLNERLGERAVNAAKQMPFVELTYTLQPVAHDLLRARLQVVPQFQWSDKQHGPIEAFWLWIEDEQGLEILQSTRIVMRPSTRFVNHEFVVVVTATPKAMTARVVSDRWLGAEYEFPIELQHLVMPEAPPPHLPLLDLPLLTYREAFARHQNILEAYGSQRSSLTFDAVQTQAFHSIFYTANNVLVCASGAQSRGVMLELAIWRAFLKQLQARVLFVVPRKALARQAAIRLRQTVSPFVGAQVVCITNSKDLEGRFSKTGSAIVVAAASAIARHVSMDGNIFGSLDLVVAHDLHALDAAFELCLSRLRWQYPNVRIVGTSAPLSDASSLAEWLNAPEHAVYAFSPSTRASSVTTSFQAFSTPHSVGLLKNMIKPAYTAMRDTSGSTIVFVPSRAQCRYTARDLVTCSGADLESSFVTGSNDAVQQYAAMLNDSELSEALVHGIAVYHEGLEPNQQRIALESFSSGIVQVLITSREACWTLPLQASLVVVMSAQFAMRTIDMTSNNEREIVDYALTDIVQMQSLAQPPRQDSSAHFLVLCQQHQAELYGRYLNQGLPLESTLLGDSLLLQTVLHDLEDSSAVDDVKNTTRGIKNRQDMVDMLSWTFVARRLGQNPSYYVDDTQAVVEVEDVTNQLSRLADRVLEQLESRCCVLLSGSTPSFTVSEIGRLVQQRMKLQGGRAVLDLVERLQSSDISRLVDVLSSRTIQSNRDSVGERDGEALKSFYQRLPRAIKQVIDGVVTDPADHNGSSDKYRRTVLLAAFCGGRVPRGKNGLEQEQAKLVATLLDDKWQGHRE
ncbi:putative steryl acetyl hydrolase mug81 [Microbotryomycetes sp. JL221]|nr:putative steryl acetyl hydrolase mug81 [Microbotryomycetes sp. JL221]